MQNVYSVKEGDLEKTRKGLKSRINSTETGTKKEGMKREKGGR
jgi:hypothetical protein